MLHRLFAHPLTRGLDLDSPKTTQLRREIIKSKPFLRKVYGEWYETLLDEIPLDIEGSVLELGSGAGFLRELAPDVITSDIFYVNGLSVILNAHNLPFRDGSLKGILMTNVLHHLPDPAKLFSEAERCVKAGGTLAMIEPWLTTWSRFVYVQFHHEPLDENIQEWTVKGEGPLSGANTALPWLIFHEGKKRFGRQFPQWKVERIQLMMPFLYLLSGGVSLRSLMFGFAFPFWRGIERLFSPWLNKLAMFAHIVLVRQ